MRKPVTIRMAVEGDFPTIRSLMERVLAPYYGGDHRAHAERIFRAHIRGGVDHVGHFSFEQRMFIAEIDSVFAGMIHLVGKRQSTYKISPLIVHEDFRSGQGVGSALLSYAEEYTRTNKGRQIYCTVANSNHGALQFFLAKGFVRAGSSFSHYKVGEREHMLYKPIASRTHVDVIEVPNVSVLPFGEQYAEQAKELILANLPKYFRGVDDRWVQALFDGYRRRALGDVNAKYKLVFIVVDRRQQVLGVIGATPKKGEPIKLMPLVASTQQAFEALLQDVPFMLARFGHKLYTHLVPTVPQTMALQKAGWTLDAAMPAAYKDDQVTQQWSLDLDANIMRTMRVKKHFYDAIMQRRKPLEVRVGYDHINEIQRGERIRLVTHNESGTIVVRDVRRYPTFRKALAVENPRHVAPDYRGSVLDLLQKIYPPDREKLGVVVLEIEPAA